MREKNITRGSDYVLKTIKSNINTIFGVVLLVFSLFGIILDLCELVYVPYNQFVYFLLSVIFFVLYFVFSLTFRKMASKTSRTFGLLMPVIVIFYNVTNSVAVHFKWGFIFLVISLILSILIWISCIKTNGVRLFAVAAGSVVSVFFMPILMIVLTFMFVEIGHTTVLETQKSFDGKYEYEVLSHDAGATGGSTQVLAKSLDRDIRLLGGKLTTPTKTLWRGGWANNPDVRWQDNDTVLIYGKPYDIK